jgi:hypothetical protein
MAFLPATFAINPNFDLKNLRDDVVKIELEVGKINTTQLGMTEQDNIKNILKNVGELKTQIGTKEVNRQQVRTNILKIQKEYKLISSNNNLSMVPSANASEEIADIK